MKYKINFDELTHTYWLDDGTPLSGITSRLGKSVFFHDKYTNIPHHILERKREHGKNVHKQIELFDNDLPHLPIQEVLSYENLKKAYKITTKSNETLVTDGYAYATAIDMVDSENNIYDHKTTYNLDKEYLSWQLSIGAYLYEESTECKVNKLFVIHFDKEGLASLIEIPRKTDAEVFDMLYTDVYMYQNDNLPSIVDIENAQLVKIDDSIANRIAYLEDTIKQLTEDFDSIVNTIGEQMQQHGIDKVEFGRVCITITKPYSRESIDSAKLKKEYPEIAKELTKTTQVQSSVKLKIKEL